MIGQYYSVPDLAARLGVSRQTLYNKISLGLIPRVKFGRKTLIPEDAVRSLLHEGRDEEQAERLQAIRQRKAQ